MKKIFTICAIYALGFANYAEQKLDEVPQDLVDKNGKPEIDLIDPFQGEQSNDVSDDDFSTTSMADIPIGLKILAIIIPKDKSQKSVALIKLPNSDKPYLVKEEDSVRIISNEETKELKNKVSKKKNIKNTGLDLLNWRTKQNFDFYIFIKKIHPTYLEIYKKKRPNEVLNLRP